MGVRYPIVMGQVKKKQKRRLRTFILAHLRQEGGLIAVIPTAIIRRWHLEHMGGRRLLHAKEG